MRALRKIAVYKDIGVTNIRHLQEKIGVYHIFEGDKRVYVGHSKYNLYKTILRHFQEWTDREQPGRITYVNNELSRYTVKVWLTSKYDAPILEETHILKYRPRDNKMKVDTYSERQRRRVAERFKNAVGMKKEEVNEWERYNYDDQGRLLDKHGEIVF